MTRSELREAVFQILFRFPFVDREEMEEQIDLYFENDEEEFPGTLKNGNKEEIIDKVRSIIEKLPEIDALISEKATGWTLDRMGKVDITIIRLAVYEILFDDKIPLGVSINEAVELAKKYGRDESYIFVNGVLAKFGK